MAGYPARLVTTSCILAEAIIPNLRQLALSSGRYG